MEIVEPKRVAMRKTAPREIATHDHRLAAASPGLGEGHGSVQSLKRELYLLPEENTSLRQNRREGTQKRWWCSMKKRINTATSRRSP